MAKTQDDPVDDLYGAPLEEFVPRRDALAKALKAGGDKEGAAAVKKLPKPTRAAWAVNRLVREQPAEVRALLDAGEALEGAQQQLLKGADREVLRGAADAARRLVEALAAEADADGATQDKVRATLHAATVDGDVREEIAARARREGARGGRVRRAGGDRAAAGRGGAGARAGQDGQEGPQGAGTGAGARSAGEAQGADEGAARRAAARQRGRGPRRAGGRRRAPRARAGREDDRRAPA